MCSRYTQLIERWRDRSSSLLSSASSIGTDVYAADEFVQANSWVNPRRSAAKFRNSVYSLANERLYRLTKVYQPTGIVRKFIRDSLWFCSVKAEYKQTLQLTRDLDARKDALLALAAEKPWYPRGFYEAPEDPDVAWQWNDSCDSSYRSCWGITVVTNKDCTDGIYAEINIYDGAGNVVDYSNDTLGSLSAGETARLSFDSFDESAQTAKLKQLDCLTY